jgi:tetratricopeptide (TPR) repeat protein
MQQHSVSPSYAAAELQARNFRAGHDFGRAATSAEAAAEIARNDGDLAAAWGMRFFQAENLLDAGDFEACAEIAAELVHTEPGASADGAGGQVNILLAKARQGAGMLEQAADAARMAARLTSLEGDMEVNVKARQALIAALAESGQLEEAWDECLLLAGVMSNEVDEQLLGKAYWVIGNVAFLCNKVDEGLKYHELAAGTFSPARNLDIWAKFNKASAAMRLAADVADADTLRCIERAELATDVIGGSDEDHILLKLNRGHWNFLAGDPTAAIATLGDIFPVPEQTSPQILGEANLLLGRSYAALGQSAEARQHLVEAADQFEKAGAPQRAEQALEFLADVP